MKPGLHQIAQSAATDGQVATWDDAAGIWVPMDPATGAGLPTGGATGQVLTKQSGTDYDADWETPSGGGSGYPPGSPDAPPTSPNAKDDEFDGSSSVTWTSTPTAPNAWDINTTSPDCAYLKANSGGASATYVGKYQSVPSMPFTITAKVSSNCKGNYQRGGGVFIAPASPTSTSALVYLGHIFHSSYSNRPLMRIKALFNGSSPTNTTPTVLTPLWGAAYVRLVVTSATSVSSYGSADGRAWYLIESGFNPGFTPGIMGVCANEESTAGPVEAYFDFFRIT